MRMYDLVVGQEVYLSCPDCEYAEDATVVLVPTLENRHGAFREQATGRIISVVAEADGLTAWGQDSGFEEGEFAAFCLEEVEQGRNQL